VFAVFPTEPGAVEAAVEAQRAVADEPWPGGRRLLVRMGIHTGEASLGGDDYVGLDVHRAVRISAAAHGGQVLV
jgi:class 3 adenylate cyclase